MLADDNPFRTERLDSLRFRADDFAWRELFDRLAERDGRGVVVGPRGSGKTTLARELADRLRQRGTEVLTARLDPDDDRRVREQLESVAHLAAPGSCVVVDGSDRIGAGAWWRFRRNLPTGCSLVLTAHRAGRLPLLYRCRTSPALFHRLVCDLVAQSATIGLPLDEIFDRHQGNVREAFLHLYDRMAGLEC